MTVPFARYVLENAGKLAFPFRRYQIQKAWRGERPQEGRYREFTQADIDVVDVGQLSPHFEAEMPLVIADVFSRFPVGDFVIQVNDRKIPERLLPGHRHHRRHRHPADRRQARQDRPRQGQGAARRVGYDARAGRPVPRTRRRSARPTSASSSRCARSVSSTRCSTRGSSRSRTSSAPGMAHAPGQARRRPAHRPRPRLLHRHRLRDAVRRPRGVGLVLLRRALRRARERRPGTPTPASASRSA